MAKFGRFEFGKDEPVETYEGDSMAVQGGYVKILRGAPKKLFDLPEEPIAVIHLAQGQSVREIKDAQKSHARMSDRRR